MENIINQFKEAESIVELDRFIKDIDLASLKSLLLQFNCNTMGNESQLRNRLLRYKKKNSNCPTVVWHLLLDNGILLAEEVREYVMILEPDELISELRKYECDIASDVEISQTRLIVYYLQRLDLMPIDFQTEVDSPPLAEEKDFPQNSTSSIEKITLLQKSMRHSKKKKPIRSQVQP